MTEPETTNISSPVNDRGPALDSLVGQLIDERYRVIELLGHGGMSEVYKAEHILMKRLVAIKIIRLQFGADYINNLERFQQEARVISALSHPNIVDAFDFFWAKGQIFMIMEFIEGETLHALLQKLTRLPVQECLKIFVQICSALENAHSKGIIHRDLKPGNIMVLPSGAIKLLDFGLAKFLKSESITDPETQISTQSGFAIGSPPYMSPEQCQGLELDNRSDLYSLGCLMYETLTGVLPIIGRNSMETIQKQLRYTPRKFKHISMDLNISPDVEAVIMKSLEKKRNDRYQSAAALKSDLEVLIAGKNEDQLIAQSAESPKGTLADSDWFAVPGGSEMTVVDALDEIKKFAYSAFDSLDKDLDGFLTEEELTLALLDDVTPWRQKSYISFLLRRIKQIESAYKEEWSPQHEGISRADIQEYFELIKAELLNSDI